MQHGRCADVDNVDFRLREQIAEIAIGRANLMLLGEIEDMVPRATTAVTTASSP
jgi:hypothetical protein